jgi:hypothetical protein
MALIGGTRREPDHTVPRDWTAHFRDGFSRQQPSEPPLLPDVFNATALQLTDFADRYAHGCWHGADTIQDMRSFSTLREIAGTPSAVVRLLALAQFSQQRGLPVLDDVAVRHMRVHTDFPENERDMTKALSGQVHGVFFSLACPPTEEGQPEQAFVAGLVKGALNVFPLAQTFKMPLADARGPEAGKKMMALAIPTYQHQLLQNERKAFA